MIFAQVFKGEYVIINGTTVIGRIFRFHDHVRRRPECSRAYYLVEWEDVTKPPERYKTLPDIHAVHQFENYPGYGLVLREKQPPRSASRSDRKRLSEYHQREQARYTFH